MNARQCSHCSRPIEPHAGGNIPDIAAWLAGFCCDICQLAHARICITSGQTWWPSVPPGTKRCEVCTKLHDEQLPYCSNECLEKAEGATVLMDQLNAYMKERADKLCERCGKAYSEHQTILTVAVKDFDGEVDKCAAHAIDTDRMCVAYAPCNTEQH